MLEHTYLDRFVRGKENKYIHGFTKFLEFDLLQTMVTYKIHDEHTFVFEFKLNDKIYRKEVRCVYDTVIIDKYLNIDIPIT
jgi:hypothetical protein